jgi:hypothetical protein
MYLNDITKATCKENYKEHFKTEYYHTKERYERLKDLNNKIEAYGQLELEKRIFMEEPKHDCPLTLLKQQQRVMGEYLHLLEVRAVIEKIEL